MLMEHCDLPNELFKFDQINSFFPFEERPKKT